MNNELLLTAIVAVLAGGIIAWFISKMMMQQRLNSLENLLSQASTQKEEIEKNCVLLRMERDKYLASSNLAQGKLQLLEAEQQKYFELQTAYGDLQRESTMLQTKLNTATEALQAKQEEIQQLGATMRVQFQNVANDILENNSKKFAEANEKRITEILQPLKTEMTNFKQKVEETYDKESKERFSLSAEVKRLVETTQMIGQEANNLTTALKGNKKQQGNWGEMLLESILDHSGLTKGTGISYAGIHSGCGRKHH
ncbi:DNA recombination protein RmuC [Phnomibacter sp. MR]|uniref:DNA recombination protein RmuC n=1 Tax=Phnomibacter sp. MR TaxID=3042318 RepID=UPI003A7FBC74